MTQHTDHATWVSLSNEEMAMLRRLLAYVEENTDRDTEIGLIRAKLDQYESPESKDQRFRDAAQGQSWVRDGECEIDDHAVVSGSDEGAYVMAWVWASREDAGLCRTAGCDEDANDGEGFDGYCGNCADKRNVVCANCDWSGDIDDLKPIKDIHQRVAPGETMPAGECPECGCLAHLDEPGDECGQCEGTGRTQSCDMSMEDEECPVCDGTGKLPVEDEPCPVNRRPKSNCPDRCDHGA